jgi:hypothetical protein
MKTITALENQTIWDIAIQEMGSIEGAFDILQANAFLRIDLSIPAGTKVQVPDSVINADVVDYLSRNGIKPATGISGEISLINEDMIRIEQVTAYDLRNGVKTFDGVRLYNLREMLSVQVNYSDFACSESAEVFIEQSLDGINYNPIDHDRAQFANGSGSVTVNITGLVTDYCRARIELLDEADGTIDSIIWRV